MFWMTNTLYTIRYLKTRFLDLSKKIYGECRVEKKNYRYLNWNLISQLI